MSASAIIQIPARTVPRLKKVRAAAQGAENVEAWDPRIKDRGEFGLIPYRLRTFMRDKLFRSTPAMQLFAFLGEEIWGNLHLNDGKVPAWTRTLSYSDLAKQCRSARPGEDGKAVDQKTLRAVITWAVETGCIALRKVGQSYQFALRPEAWPKAKAFEPAEYSPWAEKKEQDSEEAVAPAEEAKSEEEAKQNGRGLPKDRIVLMPGKRNTITLGRALKARETMFDGLRDDQPFRIDVRSDSGAAIACAAEMERGGIRIHISDHSEDKAKPNGSGRPKALVIHSNHVESSALFETLCATLDACGRPVSVRMKAECLTIWERIKGSEQERIVRDAGTRAQMGSGRGAWNTPNWTPTLAKYLDSRIWEEEPIAARKLAAVAQSEDMAEFLQQLKEARGI